MKLPVIPLPEPEYIITVSHPNPRMRRVFANAYRFLLWGLPMLTVEYILTIAGHDRWLTLAATVTVLVIAILTIDVRPDDDSGEERP